MKRVINDVNYSFSRFLFALRPCTSNRPTVSIRHMPSLMGSVSGCILGFSSGVSYCTADSRETTQRGLFALKRNLCVVKYYLVPLMMIVNPQFLQKKKTLCIMNITYSAEFLYVKRSSCLSLFFILFFATILRKS